MTALQSLQKLTHLRVIVHATVYHGSSESWVIAHSQDFIDAIRGSEFDFARTAAELARPLPSLQFLAITTSGYVTRIDTEEDKSGSWKVSDRWNVTRAYRIAAQRGVASDPVKSGEPDLVELHEEVSETIMRKEELVLSRTDEVSLLAVNSERMLIPEHGLAWHRRRCTFGTTSTLVPGVSSMSFWDGRSSGSLTDL